MVVPEEDSGVIDDQIQRRKLQLEERNWIAVKHDNAIRIVQKNKNNLRTDSSALDTNPLMTRTHWTESNAVRDEPKVIPESIFVVAEDGLAEFLD